MPRERAPRQLADRLILEHVKRLERSKRRGPPSLARTTERAEPGDVVACQVCGGEHEVADTLFGAPMIACPQLPSRDGFLITSWTPVVVRKKGA